MTKLEATFKAKLLLTSLTVDDLAGKLGISKPTLYVRLQMHNWKLGELSLLKDL